MPRTGTKVERRGLAGDVAGNVEGKIIWGATLRGWQMLPAVEISISIGGPVFTRNWR